MEQPALSANSEFCLLTTRHLALICILLPGCSGSAQDGGTPAASIAPADEADVELTLVQEGATYKLYRGGIYRINERTGRWDFVFEGYDPAFYERNYVEQDGAVFRKHENGKLYRVGQEFSDDFESARTIHDLIGVKRGWTAFTLQSAKSPTVDDYVRLRKRILTGNGDFLDNRIEPSDEVVHGGQRALRAYSVARSGDAVTNKASLETELIHFVRGDDVWFAGWYCVPVEGGMPFTLMDLETTWFKEHPGIRIMVFGEKHLGVELKWGAKPTYRQQKGNEIGFPRGQWVRVKLHITLSEEQDGVVELWQDGTQIVDARGQTLPLSHTIYNSLEVGISAHSFGPLPATLYVDDVSISARPPE
jgi:hypothetical protein